MILDARCWNMANASDVLRDSVGSSQLNYLYIPLGKNANTQIKHLLWSAEVTQAAYQFPFKDKYFAVHNYGWAKSTGESPSPWDCYKNNEIAKFLTDADARFCFTVVRNPYSRLLSGYLDKIDKRRRRITNSGPRYSLPRTPDNFAEFVDMVAEQSDLECNIHWKAQTFKLFLPFLRYDFVGRFEQLSDAFAAITRRLGGDLASVPSNEKHRTGADGLVEQLYNRELARKVFVRYRNDFDSLGYAEDYRHLSPIGEIVPCAGSQYVARFGEIMAVPHREQARAILLSNALRDSAQRNGDLLILHPSFT